MHKFWLLTKTLYKNTHSFGNKKQLVLYLVLGIAFLPSLAGVAAAFVYGYDLLAPLQMESTILIMGLFVATFFVFTVALFFTPSLLFFGSDNEGLLFLPVTPLQVGFAKLTLVLPTLYLIFAMLALPNIGVYVLRFAPNLLELLLLVITSFLLPLGALFMAAILATLVMRLIPFFKNKDLMNNLLMFLILGITLGFNFFLQSMITLDQNELLVLLTTDLPRYNQMLTMIMPFVSTLIQGAIDLNVVSLLLGMATLIALFGLCVLVMKTLLLETMTSVNASSSKKKKLSQDAMRKQSRSNAPFVALVKKEIITLLRTPIYFQNCVIINYLIPILLLFPLFFEPGSIEQLQAMGQSYVQGANPLFILSLGLAVGFLFANFNMISSTGLSRMGSKFYLMHQLPVSYDMQCHALIWTGIFFGATAYVVLIPLAFWLFHITLVQALLLLLGGAIGLVVGNYIGFIIDLIHPYLTWTNEVASVKQNVNSMAMLFVSMIGGVAMIALLLFDPFDSLLVNFTMISLAMGLASILVYNVFYRNIATYIERGDAS